MTNNQSQQLQKGMMTKTTMTGDDTDLSMFSLSQNPKDLKVLTDGSFLSCFPLLTFVSLARVLDINFVSMSMSLSV